MPDFIKPSLLPPNATTLERALETVTARTLDIPVPVRDLWDPDACPESLLPWLAWAYAVNVWDTNWSLSQKRAVVKNALYIHRHRGTLGAIERALSSLGYEIKVTEWFSANDEPYTFKISVAVGASGISDSVYRTIEKLINDAKNIRSHLKALSVNLVAKGEMVYGGALVSGEITSIMPFLAKNNSVSSLFIGVAVQTQRVIRI
jgi:phage tail P2-like protein